MTHPQAPAERESGVEGVASLHRSARLAEMYLRTGFIECPHCAQDVSTQDTDAAHELRAALARQSAPEGLAAARYTVVYEGDPNNARILSGDTPPGTPRCVSVGDALARLATLETENARLREGREADKTCIDADQVQHNYMKARLADLEVENARLRAEIARKDEALRFYADPEVYKPHPHGPAFDRSDLSYCARAALKGPTDAE